MSNHPHIRPATKIEAPPTIDELNESNDARRAQLMRQGINVTTAELALAVIIEELGDDARLRYAERLAGVLDEIEAHQRRAALLQP
jgi:hypothetical protein